MCTCVIVYVGRHAMVRLLHLIVLCGLARQKWVSTLCVCVRVRVRVRVCVCVRTRVHVHVCACVCVCVHHPLYRHTPVNTVTHHPLTTHTYHPVHCHPSHHIKCHTITLHTITTITAILPSPSLHLTQMSGE